MHASSSSSFRKKLWSFGKKKKKNVDISTSSSSSSTAASNSPPCALSNNKPLGSFPSLPESVSKHENDAHVISVVNKLSPVKQQEEEKKNVTLEQHHEHHPSNKETFAAAAALDTVGNNLLEKGDYTRARKSYERALQLKRQSLRSSSQHQDVLLASVATSINNIGYLNQRSGASPTESMAAYQDSLRIKRQVLGESSLAVGKTLNNIASVHYSCRNYAQALRAYTEAKTIMELNLGENHLDVATVFSNIGDVYMAQGKRLLAHDQYKQSLKIRWMHLDEHDSKIRRLLEKIAVIEMNQEYQLEDLENEERLLEDEDDIPIPEELHNLHSEVQADIRDITQLRRQMALDMVKDKLRILKGMRNIDGDGGSVENNSHSEEPKTFKSTPPPLSPTERKDALSSVKERLAKLREQKKEESSCCSSTHNHEEEDAEIERELGLEHLALPKLNLESILGS